MARIIIKAIPAILIIVQSWSLFSQEDNSSCIPVRLNIPEVSLIGLMKETGNDHIHNNLTGTTAEQSIGPETNGIIWLNYSSIVTEGRNNSITAHISSGSLPRDVHLKIIPGEDAGKGDGMHGKSTGQVYLSAEPQPIVAQIGSCYTGKGIGKGHFLKYLWEFPAEFNANNPAEPINITITYTMVSGN